MVMLQAGRSLKRRYAVVGKDILQRSGFFTLRNPADQISRGREYGYGSMSTP
jgi:hypothetical protein